MAFGIETIDVIAFAQTQETIEPEEIRRLKEYLFAMIVSISGVAFISLILGYKAFDISILYVGLAIASVAVALGVYIYLSREKRVEWKKEEEKEKESTGEVPLSGPPKKED